MVEKTHKILTPSSAKILNRSLAAYARNKGTQHEVKMRVGLNDGCIYLDLCNAKWQAVKISCAGAQVIDQCPVWFRREPDMDSLPIPDLAGDYNALRELGTYLGLSRSDMALITGWLLGSFCPDLPRPILILQGSAGTGKSTISTLLRDIVDPARQKSTISRPMPTTHSLVLDAYHQHTLVYDNFSEKSITNEVSDMFCTIATNQSNSYRQLYEDTNEILVKLGRCVIINGIDCLTTREDFRDRCLILKTKQLVNRKSTSEINNWFNVHHAQLLGALINIVISSLNHCGESDYKATRMVDWVRFVENGHNRMHAESGDFANLYQENRHATMHDTVATNLFVSGVLQLMSGHQSIRLVKSVLAEDLGNLYPDAGDNELPKFNKVKIWLKKYQGLLNSAGVKAIETSSRGKHFVQFVKINRHLQ